MDWERYYDLAWRARAEAFEQLDAGSPSLARLLALFDDHERRFSLAASLDNSDEPAYEPVKGFDPDPLAGLDRLDTKLIRGIPTPVSPYLRFDVSRLLADLARGRDCIVELGSGYGRQLFEIWLQGGPSDARYLGAEPSAAGRDLQRRLAEREPGLTLSGHAFTFTDPDLSFVGEAKDSLVFTCWAAYAVPSVHPDFFKRLAALPGAVTCVFIEPIGYQVPGSKAHVEASDGAARHGFNSNFYGLFQQAMADGLMEPVNLSFDQYSQGPSRLQFISVLAAVKT
ncbi:hypothetical protein A6A04_17175 [Paramagnetospirillum marisnigri]|uniref:Methyltransferase domain-containing protein n=1 Tax=Paramagnetospirillum marisnigri TaxID=1285242 RepID=A0A178MPU0_9PROT|nr:hypothetical protein [Paramagnetospirillum marisnigri]OAN50832.1 hypothetical protein A6A04_17175 [Paramagnetospirillum marisnigri]